ncbi:MAG: hypothetical protein HUU22_19115 [Phycisphaerae bacterium]|nr:hypothetical protein [Phycisphaerae bacterium]NUQ48129.1 hypothetical protein [Phycisphaerae bacterium]
MARDWFRKHSWSPSDEKDFFVRLARARVWNRAQYLRIQASELMSTGRKRLLDHAILLLNRCVAEYPEATEVVFALNDCAECHVRLGNVAHAVENYRAALERQRARPTAISSAAEDFAWLVAVTPLPVHYEEALNALAEWKPDALPLPLIRFRVAAARSMILSAMGRTAEASRHAKTALSEAARKETGLRFHRFVRLVPTQEGRMLRRLRAIAESSTATT